MSESLNLQIEGMHCGACATRIERVLSKKPGIQKANVNFATRKAYVEGDLGFEDIAAIVHDLGYEAHKAEDAKEDSGASEERREFLLSAALAFPVFVLGMFHIQFTGSGLIQLIFTTVLLAFPGRQFFERAIKLGLKGSVNMDTLVSLGVTAAYGASLVSLINGSHELYFEAAAVISCFVLLGRYLEKKARGNAVAVVESLKRFHVKTVQVVQDDGRTKSVDIEQLVVGDVVMVSPGERIPVDGVITKGSSVIDESLVSGEPLPKEKQESDSVTSSTVNVGNGTIYIRSEKVGSDSLFAKIVTLVEEAQSSKANIQRIADRVSAYFVPTVIIVAIITFAAHLILGNGFEVALNCAIAVLVVACPCALGLATPVAILVGTTTAAKDLILIRSAAGLEKATHIEAVILDKTGTLTMGSPTVVKDFSTNEASDRNVLSAIGSVERKSKHPLAMALVNFIESQQIETNLPVETKEIFGRGMQATVDLDGEKLNILAGNLELMTENKVTGVDELQKNDFSDFGVIYCAVDGKAAYAFLVDDPVRPGADKVIESLKDLKVRPVMATGDQERVAQRVSKLLGIEETHASLKPDDKLKLLERMQSEGKVVAMVGDGVNDAPTLAAADVGIAIGNGADIALDAADIIIPDGSLSKISRAIEISRKTLRNIKENLFWAFAYNVLAIPIAATGKLSPMVAAAAMGLSSVTVILNSLRLKKA